MYFEFNGKAIEFEDLVKYIGISYTIFPVITSTITKDILFNILVILVVFYLNKNTKTKLLRFIASFIITIFCFHSRWNGLQKK